MNDEKNLCMLYLVRHGETEWNKNHINAGYVKVESDGISFFIKEVRGVRSNKGIE